ncbi:MAG TPA: hypothetical protein PLS53_06300 [Thermoanaerobaculaceae bacterium]|nr:hypothetical protein [Thermoanaerobaculaceae bacterium]
MTPLRGSAAKLETAAIAVVPVGSGSLDDGALEAVLQPLLAPVAGIGGTLVGEAEVDARVPVVVLVATGGTERTILDLVARRRQVMDGEPVCLLAHPGNNSLAASLEVLARLQQDGVRGRICLVRGPGDELGLARLASTVADLRLWHAMRASRIGLVGEPSDWLVASAPDDEAVRTQWGPQVRRIPLDSVLRRLQGVPDEMAADFAATWLARAEPGEAATMPGEVAAAGRIWAALRAIIEEDHLDAVTVRCFDLLQASGASGCLALATLADEGIVAGCEGDLCAALGLLLAGLRLDRVAWMANPIDLDEDANTLRLAHCTVPPSLTTAFRLRSHFESGRSVAVAGELLPGPVTLLRIGGMRLDQAWLAEGTATPAPPAENSCRTRLDVTLHVGAVDDLLRHPLGNHLVVIPGAHARALEGCFALVMGARVGSWRG